MGAHALLSIKDGRSEKLGSHAEKEEKFERLLSQANSGTLGAGGKKMAEKVKAVNYSRRSKGQKRAQKMANVLEKAEC